MARKLPLNHEAALGCIEQGWKVFPLRPGQKSPLSANGFKDATCDKSQVSRWWEEFPTAGVGVATGSISSLLVLDVDPRNGGDETLRALVAQYGALPATLEVETGGAGVHFYFRHEAIVPGVKALWPGIDVKADGGYVVAPFSLHPSGRRYRWRVAPGKAEVALPPPWLLEAMQESLEKDLVDVGGPATEEHFVEGQRNDALTSLAGSMQRKAMHRDAILAAMLAENQKRCRPPLPEGEVVALVNSVARYEPEDPVRGKAVATPLQMVDVSEWATTSPPPVDWIIEGRLAKGDCALLVGAAGVGKSWMALDLAVGGAAGGCILGMFQQEGPRAALLVDEENPREVVWARLRHLVRAHQADVAELEKHLFLLRPCQGFTFRDKAMVTDLRRKVEAIQPELLILDSAVALSTIDNENDAVAVRRFFHDYLYPIRDICGSTIVLLHHTNKMVLQKDIPVHAAGVVRGSLDYSAAADCVLVLWPSNGVHILKAVKVRRGMMPDPLLYSIRKMEGGGARPWVEVLPGD